MKKKFSVFLALILSVSLAFPVYAQEDLREPAGENAVEEAEAVPEAETNTEEEEPAPAAPAEDLYAPDEADGLYDLVFTDETKALLDAGTVYTGEAIELPVLVTAGQTAPEPVDTQYYEVTFSDNVNAGTASVTVTAKEPYTNGCSGTFEIRPFDLNTPDTVVTVGESWYTGAPVTPEITVTTLLDGEIVTLTRDTDYTVSYQNNTKIGTAAATVTGIGNFTGSVSQQYEIRISAGQFAVSGIVNKEYTGKKITQDITVSYDGKTLVKGTDYKVSYENNIEAGPASVIITGKGSYAGSLTKTFKITKPVSSLTVTGVKNKAWTGEAVECKIVVKDGGKKLVKDTDYTVTYKNNTDPGTATVTVRGKGFYTGKVKMTFLVRKDINECKVSGIKNVTYKGKVWSFDIVVKDGSKVLVRGTDYYIKYKNNKNAGTGTVTVKGKGNYKGSYTKDFTIRKAKLTDVILKYDSLEYTGEKRTQTGTTVVKSGTMVLKKNRDFTIQYKNNLKPGTAVITVKGKGNFTGKIIKKFTITKYKLKKKDVALSFTKKAYAGKALKPEVTVTAHYINGKTGRLKASKYKVTYKKNTNAGTATVIVKGIGDCYAGTITKTFKITPVKIGTLTLPNSTLTYDGTAKKPAATVKAVVNGKNVTLKADKDYTVTYKNNTKAGTATVTVTGKGNFTGSLNKTFTIKPARISVMTVSGGSFPYSGSAICPAVKVTSGKTTLINGQDYMLSFTNNVNVGTATVTVSGRGNYTGTLSSKFTITPKSLSGAAVYVDLDAVMKNPGNQVYPSVTSLVLNGRALINGTDFTVVYPQPGGYDASSEAVAYLSINGTGNYTGSIKKQFVAMGNANFVAQDDYGRDIRNNSYRKSAEPIRSLYYNGSVKKVFYAGRDFSVTYYNNSKAGTATARIRGTSKALLGLDKTVWFKVTA